MKIRGVAAIAAGVMLAGCGALVVPVEGTASSGETFAGTAKATISSGTFDVVSSRGRHCSGVYDPLSTAKRITVPVRCTDGSSGTVDIVRDNDLMGGVGTADFTDGTTASFVFGKDRVKS